MSPEGSDFKILIALSHGGSVADAARELLVEFFDQEALLFSSLHS